MQRTRWAKGVGGLLVAGFLGLNGVAYQQAWGFTHFAPPGERTRVDHLSLSKAARIAVEGVRVPHPENRQTPRDVGLAYETHVFRGGRGAALEAWFAPRAGARGTVVLFHGHACSKDSLLREAGLFRAMGLGALLVDFYGSGGSRGRGTSIGYYEALDVTQAFRYAESLPHAGPVVLYGASMGAAAVLKAVADDDLAPAALILECPFDSLAATVRHRFTSRGLPSFPLAELLVFWGSVQEGYNGFAFRPVESASHVQVPTLLMNGEADPWVHPREARAIFDALKGPKSLKLFAGVGHDSGLHRWPDEWQETVAGFLLAHGFELDPEMRPDGPGPTNLAASARI